MEEQDRGNFDPMTNAPAGPYQPPVEPPEPVASEPAPQPESESPAPQPPAQGYYKEPSNRKWIYAGVAAVVIIAALAYFLLGRSKPASPRAATTQSHSTTSQTPAATSQIDATTKSYTSPNFNLTFSYPADWTVADNGGTQMTVTSPAMQLKDPTGQTITGQIVMTIAQAGQVPTAFNSGGGTAVRDSVKVAYTKPTSTQRANTYLSFVQYSATTATGALDGVYITGDYGYQKGQDVPKVDIGKLDPIISLTFLNSTGKPMSVANTMWDDPNFSGPLTKMLQSFAIT